MNAQCSQIQKDALEILSEKKKKRKGKKIQEELRKGTPKSNNPSGKKTWKGALYQRTIMEKNARFDNLASQ